MATLIDSLSIGLSRNWWLLLLRGAVAIAFALLTWMQPGITLVALVLLFGIYAVADGVLGVWLSISHRQGNPHWWLLLLWGLVSIAAGVLTFVVPGITALVLLMYIAGWAIITGVLQIAAAVRLRKEIDGEWLLGLSGLASVVFGVLLVWNPGAGALAVLWLIAAYAFVFGVLLVLLSLRVRKLRPSA